MLGKYLPRPQTRPNIFISLVDHADEGSSANIKIERQRWLAKPLISERSGSQYVAIVTKLVCSYSSRIQLQRIKLFCCTLAKISFFVIVDQNSVQFMTSSLD